MNDLQIVTVRGGYHVMLNGRRHFVNKRRQCSCHRPACPAVKAVADYLRAGGQRAPELVEAKPSLVCLICGAPATGTSQLWRCSQDRDHYHIFRVNQIRAAAAQRLAWLKEHEPYQYELAMFFMDDAARPAFLAAHALTYPASA